MASPIFWSLIIPIVIVSFIIWIGTKKLYKSVYFLSIVTYIVAVVYAIVEFRLEGAAIVLLLAVSSLIMIVIGLYIAKSKIQKTANEKK